MSRRIRTETCRLLAETIPGIKVKPDKNNLRLFYVILDGPRDSPFEDGKFKLELYLPTHYPMEPPRVRFLTKIYHPNIDYRGRICLDVLAHEWSPVLQIRTILQSIQALLSAPNPRDPVVGKIGALWLKDEGKALEKAREYTLRYATLYKNNSEDSDG